MGDLIDIVHSHLQTSDMVHLGFAQVVLRPSGDNALLMVDIQLRHLPQRQGLEPLMASMITPK